MAINKNKVQLQETVLDSNGHPLSSTDVNPLTSSDCVYMENGMTLEDVMGNDTISTPTIMNEDTSFKVGIGDSETKVIDSDVAKMVIEGKTYQNILPKPTTLIMNTDEKEFKINDKIDSNIVLDDNVAEIATIKGQTYVNTVQEESASEYVAIDEELNGQSITTTGKPEGYVKNATLEGLTLVNTIQEPSEATATVLDLDADIDAQYATIDNTVQGGIHGAKLNGMTLVNLSKINQFSLTGANALKTTTITSMIKPNTKYTRILVITENTLTDSSSIYVAQMQYGLDTQMVCYTSGAEAQIATNFIGVAQKRVFTTPDDLSTYDNMSGIRIFSTNSGGTLKGYEIILEGDYTNVDIPYFEGMQSVKMPVLKTVGKNLFDGKLEIGFLGDLTGQPNTANKHKYTPSFIKIDASKKYCLHAEADSYIGVVNAYYYDANKNYLGYGKDIISGINTNSSKLFTPHYSDASYIRFRFFKSDNVELSIDVKNIAFYESSTIIDMYEPYKSNILSTSEDVVLRKVGDVQDELDLETGKLTQRIGEIVLDGSEGWWDNTDYVTDTLIEFGYNIGASIKDGNTIICDKFQPTDVNGVERICILQNGNVYIRILKTKVTTVDEFKAWLASNPITIQYLLKTPIIKTVNLSIVDQDNNTVKSIQTQPILTHITASSNGLIPFVTIPSQLKYPTIIKPSTTYTVQLKQTTVNSEFPLTINLGGTVMAVPSTKFTITTPETLTSQDVIFTGKNNVISKLQLIEGDVTGIDYPFFEGMSDVKFTKYIGENLVTNKYQGSIKNDGTLSTTSVTEHTLAIHTNIMQVEPNATYRIENNLDLGFDRFAFYDANMNFLSRSSTYYEQKIKEFTMPSNVYYVRVALFNGNKTLSPSMLTYLKIYKVEGDVTTEPKLLARGKNLLNPSILNPIITNSTKNYAGVNFTYNSDGSFTVSGTFTSNITLHGNTDEFIKLLKDGVRYRTSEMMLMEVFSLDGNVRWTNDFIFDKNNHVKVSPYYQWNGVVGQSINKTYYPQVEIGDNQTTYEPYKGVTIEQDIDSIPLTSDMFEQGNILADNIVIGSSYQQIGRQSSTTRISAKTLIKVKPNCTYTLQSDNIKMWMMAFDKNGGHIKNMELSNTITTDANTYYLGLKLQYNDDSDISPSTLDSLNLTLQEVTDEIVLRSIGDVKDTLNLTTGEYVQRIGEVVYDGSDDEFWRNEEDRTTYAICKISLPQSVLGYADIQPSNIICDNIMTGNTIKESDGKEQVSVYHHKVNNNDYSEVRICLPISYLPSVTVQDFRNYIKNHPFKIQYQLETPIIHKVNLTNTTKLPSYNSTTHYDTIVPSNSLIPNIKILSTIDYNVAIKPSTQYTIRANTTDALSVDLGGSEGTLTDGKVTLTTPSTLAHNSLKLENGKAKEVMVIEGNEIKDNVPFFNGMKNVQMGGIKLVNIARFKNVTALVTANANKTQFTYTGDGSGWGYVIFDNTLLKPNTKYTIYMNVVTTTSDSGYPIKITYGHNTKEYTDIIQTGIFKKAITTIREEDGFDRNIFSIAFRPCSLGGQVVIQNPMIIEGDWTHLDEIPFIESEMIIEQPIIRSQGKNLFDMTTLKVKKNCSNQIKSLDGQKVVFTTAGEWSGVSSGWMKLKPNTTYTFGGEKSRNEIKLFYRLRLNNGDVDSAKTAKTFTTQNSGEVIFNFETSVSDNVDNTVSNVYLYEGNITSPSYEPFKQHTLSSNRVIGYEEGVHYGYGDGTKYTNAKYNSILADVEGLSIAYVTGGSSNFTFWDKDGVFISGKGQLDTALSSTDKNGFVQVPSNAKYMKFASANTIGSATDYTKATVTGELPLRSLPNGVCDSFNLVTGEYVQRVGEVVLDGSSDENWTRNNDNNDSSCFYSWKLKDCGYKLNGEVSCDYFKELNPDRFWLKTNVGFFGKNGNGAFYLVVTKDMITAYNNSIVEYLSQNPITVQYELATPIVRKIGLTAKGNYKEVELNGSENWNSLESSSITTVKTYFAQYFINDKNASNRFINIFNDEDFPTRSADDLWTNDIEGMSHNVNGHIQIRVTRDKLDTQDINGFKRWLSQHPIKVGYISTTQSATTYSNILKPIFFNNVKVQFMNDNVDIQPTLTLQARSRNSYVMDMMKANTVYTLKALANPNSFTIDGTSYSAGTNSTFTSPSTLTNKLLITGQDVQELMIIEGDVTGKTIPYYKGIRSSFDNTDKVEVLSQNKNLFDINVPFTKDGSWSTVIEGNSVISTRISDNVNGAFGAGFRINNIKPNTKYILSLSTKEGAIYVYSNSGLWGDGLSLVDYGGGSLSFTTKSDTKYITIGLNYGRYDVGAVLTTTDIKLEEGSVATPYQPHKENSTIINMPMQLETVEVVKPVLEKGGIENSGQNSSTYLDGVRTRDLIPVKPNMLVSVSNNSVNQMANWWLYDINKNFIKKIQHDNSFDSSTLTIPENTYFVRIHRTQSNIDNLILTLKEYKPIQLNSLPNGVKDELIINRATSSAKLIRRVGKVVLDGSENWTQSAMWSSKYGVFFTRREDAKNNVCLVLDRYKIIEDSANGLGKEIGYYSANDNCYLGIMLSIPCNTLDELRTMLKDNPLVAYYELAEPVIIEIRLKGYPFVYEDGSISLNTDIAPITRTSYNVNQHQLINSQNETIIRHDKQISDLYDYIEIYLDEIYRMELFKMQLELSL